MAPKCSKYAAKDSRSKMLHMPSKLGILVPKCRKIARKTATDRKMEIAPEFFGSRKLTVVDSEKKKQPCNHICFWGFPTQTQDKDLLTGPSFCWLPALPLCMDSSAHSSPKSIIGVLTRNLATKCWDGVFLMAYHRRVAPCYGVYVRWFLLGGWGGAASQSRRSAKAGLDA